MNASWLPTTKQLALVIYAATLLALNSAADGQPMRGACGSYKNSAGNWVPRPCKSTSEPGARASGATALCGDGTYSYSQRLDETCSHHGGAVLFLP